MAASRLNISHGRQSSDCLRADIGLAAALRRLCVKAEINTPVADVRPGPRGHEVVIAQRSTACEPDSHLRRRI